MNEIKIFENSMFGKVRTIELNGEPYFAGRDVVKALGYSNVHDALNKHVDKEDKGVAKCDTLGGTQDITVINESGVYSLVFGSKLPKAKEFKRWVTSEILPSIRRHGAYMTDDILAKTIENPDFLISLLNGSYNMPTQRSMEMGLFEVKEHVINNPDGSIRVTKTPKVTGKGQRYFVNKFLGNKEEM